jgi:hypothetical protein
LFVDLNRDLLGPPGDNTIIVISDSEEVEREDEHTDIGAAPSSLRVSLTPSASATDDNGTPDQVQDDSSGGGSEDEVDTPLAVATRESTSRGER